jgi:hypothetical protein
MSDPVNPYRIRYGTIDGEIKFGHLTSDRQIDAVLIRNFKNWKHYIELCATGKDHRKNGTIIRAPGSCQIKAGDNVGKGIPGVYVEAVSGDLVLRAPSGKVRIEGLDVEITATGGSNTRGNVNVTATEKIILNSDQMIDINAPVQVKIVSEKTVDVTGKTVLNLYGGFMSCADAAATAKTSLGPKGGSSHVERIKAEL